MSVFDRAAARIGDLDSPFYDEERHRDVWNEASAVAFQFLLWGLLVGAVVATWLGGDAARPYVFGAMMLLGAAGFVVMSYARRQGVDVAQATRGIGRGRAAVWMALVVLLVVGLFRDTPLDLPTMLGAATGAALVLGVAAVAVRAARRHASAADDSDDA